MSDDDDNFIKKLKKKRRPSNCIRKKTTNNSRHMTSLAVIDLDETLIDSKYKLYFGADKFLEKLRQHSYILLWTMGNEQHVNCFFKEYPQCKILIDSFKCGLVNKTKPVNVARQLVYDKIKKYFPTTFLVDDNSHHLKNSCYDLAFNVLDYLSYNNKMDYVKLYSNISAALKH
ncbi:MAG: DUF705 domain-containing protein [Janthinobacterium lividum]